MYPPLIKRAVFATLFLFGMCTFTANAASDSSGGDIFIFSNNNDSIDLFVGETIWFNLSVVSISVSGTFQLSARAKDGDVSFGISTTPLNVIAGEGGSSYEEVVLRVMIIGKKITIGTLEVVAMNEDGISTVVWNTTVNVNRVEPVVARYVRYLVLVSLIVGIFLIGVTTDINIVVKLVRRPYGVIIGMVCQFVIMPFTAWAMANVFRIDGPASLGLVLDGSCPGGSISNVLSVLLDVDYVLSITMTFFSTILALGMMPFNLFVYGRAFVAAGETIKTPFLEIFIQLVSLAVPLGIGIFLGWWKPKMKIIADRYVKPVSGAIIVVLLCTDLPFNLFIFDSPWEYFAVAMLFPLVGATSGFLISKVLRLSTKRSVTVALETGVQNAVLAITVLYFFYERPVSDLATRLPYLILVFTSIEGVLLTALYMSLKRFYWHQCPYDDEEEEEDGTGKDDKGEEKTSYEVTTRDIATISGKESPRVAMRDVGSEANFGDDSLAQVNVAFQPE